MGMRRTITTIRQEGDPQAPHSSIDAATAFVPRPGRIDLLGSFLTPSLAAHFYGVFGHASLRHRKSLHFSLLLWREKPTGNGPIAIPVF